MAKIVKATDAKIVLSSDWRYYWCTKDEFENNEKFRQVLKAHDLEVYDITRKEMCCYDMLARSREIKDYLVRHKEVEGFVILEDYWDMGDLEDHTVYTNESIGLTDENADLAIKILKGEI